MVKRGDFVKRQDIYKETITITFPNMIATIHIPDLTKEELNNRMSQIKKASTQILSSQKGVVK